MRAVKRGIVQDSYSGNSYEHRTGLLRNFTGTSCSPNPRSCDSFFQVHPQGCPRIKCQSNLGVCHCVCPTTRTANERSQPTETEGATGYDSRPVKGWAHQPQPFRGTFDGYKISERHDLLGVSRDPSIGFSVELLYCHQVHDCGRYWRR